MSRRVLDGLTKSRTNRMQMITARILQCKKCPLCRTRTRVVPGEGSLRPEILFVGEAPGEDEDLTGRPFVGKAGQ
ncbi:MAG: hypothetical protein N2255_00410, partial [Kiritimatiellae bacterium]|nr:hypothetical protein [Kiritimatiellia bacterium]